MVWKRCRIMAGRLLPDASVSMVAVVMGVAMKTIGFTAGAWIAGSKE